MSPAMWEFLELAPLGFLAGIYGTIIGTGGGFVLVPALLLMLPHEQPATITSMSLAVAFFNTYSGTIAYLRVGRIDYRAALVLGLAGLPGAVLGPMLTHQMPRALFGPVFGLVLLGGGLWIAARPRALFGRVSGSGCGRVCSAGRVTLIGAVGVSYICTIATLFGLGGGVLYVPFLIRVLGFPPHMATATVRLFLTLLTLVATLTHLGLGAFHGGLDRTMYLAVGVMMGAPLGAMIASKLKGRSIVRLLALAVVLVSLRLLLGPWLRGW